jgi:acyl-homoserine lactone acylase PvdQ
LQLMQVLEEWDGSLAAESRGAAAYHLWVDSYFHQLFGKSLGPELLRRYLSLPESDPEAVLLKVLQGAGRGSNEVWVQKEKQQLDLLVSMSQAWTRLGSRDLSHKPLIVSPLEQGGEMWRWGELHALRFRPLFGEGEEISTIAPLPSAGDSHSIGAAAFDGAQPFDVRVTSIYHFAVDTSEMEIASASLVPGQSEHPGHPHFSDGLDAWREGKLGTFNLGKNQENSPGERNLRLQPLP